ncbi:MAG: aminopeptidase N, partial [Alphaproteobacteria bacterium]|nr:aminopeptidase N [Alphaproteobacteria bacterium]
LNIFNSNLLLADPATATDLDYERIEGVVAHEYFHNWTGNRITCRDWFQLCLKEGLTVFRDQSFSADMRGHAVQRIKEVRALRARQFAEDASPIAHPVRPSAYVKIDNFYTATIYEKGAELIRMLKLVIGETAFARGMDLYFDRHDGEATTVEAFIACFAQASGRDLSDFFVWYEQAGTPRVSLETAFDAEARRATLTFRQSTAPTPGQPDKRPLPIPVRLGLMDAEGEEIGETRLCLLEGESLSLEIPDLDQAPVVSALRGFSAPVTLDYAEPARDAYLRLAADSDLFNRWEAGQGLARDLILGRAAGRPDEVGEERFADALGRALRDQSSDPAFKALLLALPSESDLALISRPADPHALHEARDALRRRIAVHLADLLRDLHGTLQEGAAFSADAAAAGRRALRNAALMMLAADTHALNRRRAEGHFDSAGNMTDAMGGLTALVHLGGPEAEAALARFYETWKAEPLVLDKWFQVQALDPGEGALGRVLGLTAHPAFEARNPNRVRSLVLAFAVGNPARFHDVSGAGYRWLAEQVLAADAFNPNLAARLVEPLTGWRNVIPALGEPMREALARLAAVEGLSAHVRELAEKGLA